MNHDKHDTIHEIRLFLTNEPQKFTFKPENPFEVLCRKQRCTYKLSTCERKLWDTYTHTWKATPLKYHLDIYKNSNQRISKWKCSCFINFVYFFSLQVTVITTFTYLFSQIFFPFLSSSILLCSFLSRRT